MRAYCPDCGRRCGLILRPERCAKCGRLGRSRSPREQPVWAISIDALRAEMLAKHPTVIPSQRKGRTPRPAPTPESDWWAWYDAYLATPEWAARRRLVIARDRVCQGSADPGLHVHHLHYRTVGRETGEELVLLCKRCHEAEHARGPIAQREAYWTDRLRSREPDPLVVH